MEKHLEAKEDLVKDMAKEDPKEDVIRAEATTTPQIARSRRAVEKAGTIKAKARARAKA